MSGSISSCAGEKLRLAILQRVCTGYRLSLFEKLSDTSGLQTRLFLGEDLPESKVRSAKDLSSIDYCRLNTLFFRVGSDLFPWHHALLTKLEEFAPNAILCEGESNFFNNFQALRYRSRHPEVRLIHWSLGGLPGVSLRSGTLRSQVKVFFQKRFDFFITYSSFGKECLIKLGHHPNKIVVAVNVADTESHCRLSDECECSPSEARSQLGLPNRFTVLYSGAMEPNKNPGLLLDLAHDWDFPLMNFVLLGDGPMLKSLRDRTEGERLDNVFLPGRVGERLPLYYRAGDVMVLPGRGGMVISEAMAWSLPVLLHSADGTEYDLLQNGETGYRLRTGSIGEYRDALKRLADDEVGTKEMGRKGRALLEREFTITKMRDRILDAVKYSLFGDIEEK